MGLFGRKKDKPAKGYDGPPIDPEWARNRNGKFFRLIHFDPVVEGLRGIGGVFVVWHSGVKPRWVYVAMANDLAPAMEAVMDRDDIMEYDINGGLFITWSPIKDKFRPGVLRYLHENMDTLVPNPEAKGIKNEPIRVMQPGRREQAPSGDGPKTTVPSGNSD